MSSIKIKKYAGLLVVASLLLALAGCAPKPTGSALWARHMQHKLAKYTLYAKHSLGPYFARAGVRYPPKKIALLAYKHSRKLNLWAKGKGDWRFIRSYPILAASGHLGPKLREGDRQVPEGIYGIDSFNPDSHFTLSMKVSYPNDFDREMAEKEGRIHLGGDIFIHGKHRSIGCLAVGDPAIEQLFVLAHSVGRKNVEIIIAPNNFNKADPIYTKYTPGWATDIYAEIIDELKKFSRVPGG